MTCRSGDLREEVGRIRAALAAGYSVAHLARRYSCHWETIKAIRDGHVYKDLLMPEPQQDAKNEGR
ncbi:hypothetical protein D7Y15_23425 [Corallococcus sp. AB030]|uniref:hypothetical protein n=1 Tax=Corallococcus sp. AB030 TaxID=2316716 RepID=UPI000EE1B8C9|nr:hypothetical protein [Corallococcus sp. AB030]RKI09729.1 hypothetical protein D7Y15_23425 [Corallococcus sp. AB030]